MVMPGQTATWTLMPCGADCTNLTSDYAPKRVELRMNGSTWTGTFQLKDPNGTLVTCTRTFDPGRPSAVDNCPGNFTNWVLTKN